MSVIRSLMEIFKKCHGDLFPPGVTKLDMSQTDVLFTHLQDL